MGFGLGEPLKVVPKGFVWPLPNSEQAAKGYWFDESALEVAAGEVSELGLGLNGAGVQRLEPAYGHPF